MSDIVRNVKSSNQDVVVFMGSHYSKLIRALDNETDVFKLPLVTIMMSGNADHVDLRLDTNVVSIEENKNPDDYILRDIYSIKRGPKLSKVFGTWSNGAGLSVKTSNIYERRQNLGGIKLRDAILPYAKITKPNYDQNDRVIDSGGVFQDIRKKLQKMMNFTVEQRAPHDKKWGSLKKDGKTWNGMILELTRDELDLCSSGLSITYDRALAADYR